MGNVYYLNQPERVWKLGFVLRQGDTKVVWRSERSLDAAVAGSMLDDADILYPATAVRVPVETITLEAPLGS